MFVNVNAGEKPAVRFICTEEEKLELLEAMGIDIVCNVPFDEKVMSTAPTDFIRDVLKGSFNAAGVSCGFNYRFGLRASGDVELLRKAGGELGMEIYAHEPVTVDGKVVSSTAIRGLIDSGNMELCARYLGRPYALSGKVIGGRRIGRSIGFPTANLLAGDVMQLPPNGVYVSRTVVLGKVYDSVTNIGVKPTIGDSVKTVETHLLDFAGDLYGKNIKVQLLHWSRPERKFADVDELMRQISCDRDFARSYHSR